MKEMDVLKAMNDIDEEYVEEATPPVKEEKKRAKWVPMRYIVTVGVFAAVLVCSTWVLNLAKYNNSPASGSAVQESVLATEEKAADDSAPAEAPEAAVNDTVSEEAREEAVSETFIVPNTYGEYGSVTFTTNQDGTEKAVFKNEKGRAGLTLTRKPNDGRTEGLIEEMTVNDGIMIREAGWCANGYIYHAVFAKPVLITEVLQLMEEVR